MNSYTPQKQPVKGTGKRIWDMLISRGYAIRELHYHIGIKGAGGWSTCNEWLMQLTNGEVYVVKYPGTIFHMDKLTQHEPGWWLPDSRYESGPFGRSPDLYFDVPDSWIEPTY